MLNLRQNIDTFVWNVGGRLQSLIVSKNELPFEELDDVFSTT
jgi:hypothetical protein